MPRLNASTFTGIASLVMAGLSAGAAAQERVPWPSERFNPPPQQYVAGEFDYYALVLSWSPTYCITASNDDSQQCDRDDGRRYAFVLHGLWPQYEKGYPELCRTPRRPFVPQPLIDSMLDIMPSGGLVVHEYRTHGTCSGLPPESYFSLARQLYGRIQIPERFQNPFEVQQTSPSEIMRDFIRANPFIRPDTIAIACGGAGNRLTEIHFCFAKDGWPRRCGDNENQRRMCSADSILVPPVRSTSRDDQEGGRTKLPGSPASKQLPRPRLIETPNGF